MALPKISIIIVVKNAAATIRACINSVVNQNYSFYELIIIDGASTDGTLEILSEYHAHIHHLTSETDKGIYDAMNKAINYCTGDYLYFLGSDDELFDKNVLVKLFSIPHKAKEIVYGNAFYTHRKVVRFGKMNGLKLSKHNFNHQTVFYPRAVFQQYSYKVKYKLWADYLMNIQLYFKTDFIFKYMNVMVCKFNDLGSSGKNNDLDFERDSKEIRATYLPINVHIFFRARKIFLHLKTLLAANGPKKN